MFCIYNDVKTLDISTVYTSELQKQYPCAFITTDKKDNVSGTVNLYISNTPVRFRRNQYLPGVINSEVLSMEGGKLLNYYGVTADLQEDYGDSWREGTTFEKNLVANEWTIISGYPRWTNTDILDEYGTLYLAASEPVPVGGGADIEPAALLNGLRIGQIVIRTRK